LKLPGGKPGASGGDQVEFIFAPNLGEAARPLRAIASSGEMARVMLAVENHASRGGRNSDPDFR